MGGDGHDFFCLNNKGYEARAVMDVDGSEQ